MQRWLAGSVLFLFLAAGARGRAAAPVTADPTVLQRFFDSDNIVLSEYRAHRHLEARNDHFDKQGWMDVWTEADVSGFRYEVIAEGGSAYIKTRLFLAALDAERDLWTTGAARRGAITPENYTFEDFGEDEATGLTRVKVTPRRKDVLLFDGWIFLRSDAGDLVRITGLLSKAPSFWTRRVEIVREYERVAGVRVPVAFRTVANLRLAGKSTFTMSYAYERINGQMVGHSPAKP